MTTLKFADTHNMFAFLSKPTESDGFKQIVDFLNAHPIRYALTINPTIYISCIEQFWSTIKVKTINGEAQLHALVDGKKIIITESSVRRDLQLANKEGVDCLPNSTIFEQPALMGGGPGCQETMGDTIAQTRFESVSLHYNDSMLARGNTLRSDEDRLKLDELMALCTTLQNQVLDLEKRKTSQHNEIFSLKMRVKKLEKKDSLGEDASKQGKIDAIDVDEEITLANVHDVNAFADEEMFVAEQEVAKEVVEVINTTKPTVSAATTTTIVDDITLAQALREMKSTKPKMKGVVIQELAKFDEEERLAREKVEKEEEANIALIETWDDIQAKIDADHQLAKRMQAQEQEELSIEENTTLFQ
ncbi:hypothetical protein Tco_0269577 [Tanacetum coccineum]